MEIKQFSLSHYPDLCLWWSKHKWMPVSYDALPKVGLVIEGVCAGFIYQTDSSICWIEWVISNPESNKEERNKALDLLLDALVQKAKDLGYTIAFTSVQHPKLLDRYKEHNFQVTDTGMSNMMRVL